jgi:hypothetical protein
VRSRGTTFADTRLIPRSCISIAWHVPNDNLNSSAISGRQTSVPTDYCIDTVNSLVGSRRWWPVCVWIIVDGRAAIFKSGIAFKCLGRLNAVSPNACCRISYVSVAVLQSFWQNFIKTRCSFNTSSSQYDRGTNTIALEINSRLIQAAIRSSGMWRQDMLHSILHGCYFDTISSFSKKILSRIFLIRPRIGKRVETSHAVVCSI